MNDQPEDWHCARCGQPSGMYGHNGLCTPDIDLRAQPGDLTYRCDICTWSITLKPDAAARWTEGHTIVPRCRKDDRPLTVTVHA